MLTIFGEAIYQRPPARLGDSLAVELPALTRAAQVQILVPQPNPDPSPRCNQIGIELRPIAHRLP